MTPESGAPAPQEVASVVPAVEPTPTVENTSVSYADATPEMKQLAEKQQLHAEMAAAAAAQPGIPGERYTTVIENLAPANPNLITEVPNFAASEAVSPAPAVAEAPAPVAPATPEAPQV